MLMGPLLRRVPLAVLFGVFLYMGFADYIVNVLFYLRCVCVDGTVAEESAPGCVVCCISLHGDH